MFPPELPPECSSHTACLEWLAIHRAGDEVLIFDNDSQFAVMVSEL
jgi:hypothetical protein